MRLLSRGGWGFLKGCVKLLRGGTKSSQGGGFNHDKSLTYPDFPPDPCQLVAILLRSISLFPLFPES